MADVRIGGSALPEAPERYDRSNEQQFRGLIGDLKNQIDNVLQRLVSDELDGDNIAYVNAANTFDDDQVVTYPGDLELLTPNANTPGSGLDFPQVLRIGKSGSGSYIVARQLSADSDSQGLRFYTHPSGTAAAAAELAMTLGDGTESPSWLRAEGNILSKGAKISCAPDSGQSEFEAISTDSVAFVAVNAPAGNVRDIRFQTSNTGRWNIRANQDAESGSNAGSTFLINARADNGSSIGNAVEINRADLAITFGGAATFNGLVTFDDGQAWTFAPSGGRTMTADASDSGSGGVITFDGGGPFGFEVFDTGVLDSVLYYRTTPQQWVFEDGSGNDALAIDVIEGNIASGETALSVLHKAGGSTQRERVSVGVLDSGGSGYRVLRIPN